MRRLLFLGLLSLSLAMTPALATTDSSLVAATDRSVFEPGGAVPEQLGPLSSAGMELQLQPWVAPPRYEFSGLAAFYNQWVPFEGESYSGWRRRFDLILIHHPGSSVEIDENSITLIPGDQTSDHGLTLYRGPVDEVTQLLADVDPGNLSYQHLWGWLRPLARLAETTLYWLHGMVSHWGIAILLLALLVKLVLLPLTLWSNHLQRSVTRHQSELNPVLAAIKREHDGEEAHNRIMAAYRERGITPFHTLKPMLSMLILIPVFIAVFNALGEMTGLRGEPLWWIADLSLPDRVASLPWQLPLLGDGLNLLPLVMTGLTVLATLTYQNSAASNEELHRQKRNLLWMAMAFLILFYPFPSAMVLYWACVNLLHAVQQRVIRL